MSARVINLQEHRIKRTAEQRRLRNQQFTETLLARWFELGPASGHKLFDAILAEIGKGATPERAAILLPVLLEVLDEMEANDAA